MEKKIDKLTLTKAFENGRYFEKKRILKMLKKGEKNRCFPMGNFLDVIYKLEKEHEAKDD